MTRNMSKSNNLGGTGLQKQGNKSPVGGSAKPGEIKVITYTKIL